MLSLPRACRQRLNILMNAPGAAMKTGSPSLFVFIYSLCSGLCLMCFALLLHPMSPEDFLLLSLTAPQATWRHAYGIQAAILFWISAALVAVGAVGVLHRAVLAARCMIAALKHSDAAAPARAMRAGWSI
jgi:hypothetical protein